MNEEERPFGKIEEVCRTAKAVLAHLFYDTTRGVMMLAFFVFGFLLGSLPQAA